MKPEIKYVMMYPGNAVAHVRHIYNGLPETHRRSFLLHERSLPESIKGEVIKEFQSRQTIDINASELLGIGVVGTYYNFTSEHSKRTFQSIVGIQDIAKRNKEALLSDGAIWEIEAKTKMIFQQAMVQGYYPKPHNIAVEDIVAEIKKKVDRKNRGDYPTYSGLIVNVFSDAVSVDVSEVTKNSDIESFGSVYLVFYSMPDLSKAIVYYLRKNDSPFVIEQLKMNLNLSTFEEAPSWTMNIDESKWNQ